MFASGLLAVIGAVVTGDGIWRAAGIGLAGGLLAMALIYLVYLAVAPSQLHEELLHEIEQAKADTPETREADSRAEYIADLLLDWAEAAESRPMRGHHIRFYESMMPFASAVLSRDLLAEFKALLKEYGGRETKGYAPALREIAEKIVDSDSLKPTYRNRPLDADEFPIPDFIAKMREKDDVEAAKGVIQADLAIIAALRSKARLLRNTTQPNPITTIVETIHLHSLRHDADLVFHHLKSPVAAAHQYGVIREAIDRVPQDRDNYNKVIATLDELIQCLTDIDGELHEMLRK